MWRRKSHKAEAQAGVTWTRVRERLGPPGAGKVRKDVSSEPWDFWPPDRERGPSCCSPSPSEWCLYGNLGTCEPGAVFVGRSHALPSHDENVTRSRPRGSFKVHLIETRESRNPRSPSRRSDKLHSSENSSLVNHCHPSARLPESSELRAVPKVSHRVTDARHNCVPFICGLSRLSPLLWSRPAGAPMLSG